jgi:hypothetical protein
MYWNKEVKLKSTKWEPETPPAHQRKTKSYPNLNSSLIEYSQRWAIIGASALFIVKFTSFNYMLVFYIPNKKND